MNLVLRRFLLRNTAHKEVYNGANSFGLACDPRANSLIQNPFRTKTNTCEQKRKVTDETSPSQFALCFASCMRSCCIFNFFLVYHSLTHEAEPFLRSCQLCSYSRTSQHIMELGGSSPHSHKPSTGHYPGPDRSNPHHPILPLQDPF
jgi:hypothetical protein